MAAAPASAPDTNGMVACQRGDASRPYTRASWRHCCSVTNCTAVYGTVSSWPGTVPRHRPCAAVGRSKRGGLGAARSGLAPAARLHPEEALPPTCAASADPYSPPPTHAPPHAHTPHLDAFLLHNRHQRLPHRRVVRRPRPRSDRFQLHLQRGKAQGEGAGRVPHATPSTAARRAAAAPLQRPRSRTWNRIFSTSRGPHTNRATAPATALQRGGMSGTVGRVGRRGGGGSGSGGGSGGPHTGGPGGAHPAHAVTRACVSIGAAATACFCWVEPPSRRLRLSLCSGLLMPDARCTCGVPGAAGRRLGRCFSQTALPKLGEGAGAPQTGQIQGCTGL